MTATNRAQFINFLQEDLAIPAPALFLALQHPEQQTDLPMILWQYGLITLTELDRIFDWLFEHHSPSF